MPGLDGWDILRRLADDDSLHATKVALLTAEADEMVERRARRQGVDVYLVKPLDGSDLTRAVRGLLEPAPPSTTA
jgi:DNA-binding response OmpR family regulator